VSTNEVIPAGRRRRRRHSELFKAEAVGACQQEGVSIAAVALARGVNANLLRRWVVGDLTGRDSPSLNRGIGHNEAFHLTVHR
jgi:hypothetical protein